MLFRRESQRGRRSSVDESSIEAPTRLLGMYRLCNQ